MLVLLDGVADRSQISLGGLTPLQAAGLPNLDALASAGSCASMYPMGAGICPDTAESAWTILGYGGYEFCGRAGIEAAGAGADLRRGDVAFRVDLAATMVDGGERYVQVSPVSMPEEQAADLARALAGFAPGPLQASLRRLGGSSMVLVFSGGASDLVTDSDPVFYRTPVPRVEPLEGAGEAARRTADELNRFSRWAQETLACHPVTAARSAQGMTTPDYVLLSSASVSPDVRPFEDEWGFRAMVLASGPLFRGLARVLGMEFEEVASREAGEDLYGKLLAARSALAGGFDMAVVHSGAAAEMSRSGRATRKVRVLEELDLAMTMVVEAFARDTEVLTVVTSCCTSPSSDTDEVLHSGEPVPALFLGRSVRADRVETFDEISCAAGCLGTIGGRDVMPLVLDFTNRARFGAGRRVPGRRKWRESWSGL